MAFFIIYLQEKALYCSTNIFDTLYGIKINLGTKFISGFVPVSGMACSYWKIFIPPTYDLGKFKRDLGKRASSLFHMNAIKILLGKQLRGEIIGRRARRTLSEII